MKVSGFLPQQFMDAWPLPYYPLDVMHFPFYPDAV